jgi:hypothetical protein
MGGGASGDGNYNSSVIETRLYSSTESTEMLLFKGNDISSTSGPDRIRLRGGAIAFDTYSVATTDRNAESIRMYINDTGNIGIGTTNPVQLLDINGSMVLSNLSSSRLLLGNATIGSARLNIRDLNQKLIEFQYLTNTVGNITCLTNGSGLLLNGGGGSSQLVLASTGNVGINSTRPNASLDINTSNTFGQLYLSNSVQNRKIVLWDNNGNNHQYFGLGVNDATLRYQINGQGDSHIFYAGTNSTTSNELFRITGGGNINVANTANIPTISSGNILAINITTTSMIVAGGGLLATFNSNTLGNIFTTGGNVGMGTTSPGYKLHVTGDIYSSGDITAFSDIRLKENIVQLTGCLDKIDNIRGVSFSRIDTGKKHIGLIAQEVEEEFPELVATDHNNGFKSVNYGNVVAILLECIRELKGKVNDINMRV